MARNGRVLDPRLEVFKGQMEELLEEVENQREEMVALRGELEGMHEVILELMNKVRESNEKLDNVVKKMTELQERRNKWKATEAEVVEPQASGSKKR